MGHILIDRADAMAGEAPDLYGRIQSHPAPKPSGSRLVIALALLAFIAILSATIWLVAHWQGGWRFGSAPADPAALASGTAVADNATDLATASPESAASTRPPSLMLSAEQQTLRMLDLEQRLTRVAVAAQSASGYANRAEAIMIAFSARRALDAGDPLGYVEGQLRVLFGDAQPKAVATIVNASAKPVTISNLRAGLETIGAAAEQSSASQNWWTSAVHELHGLTVIRPAGAPSPEPSQKIARARLHVESGQIEEAMREIAGLRQQPETTRWLDEARRYNEAHRALDVIEAAAILEPRTAPMVAPATTTPATAPDGSAAR